MKCYYPTNSYASHQQYLRVIEFWRATGWHVMIRAVLNPCEPDGMAYVCNICKDGVQYVASATGPSIPSAVCEATRLAATANYERKNTGSMR